MKTKFLHKLLALFGAMFLLIMACLTPQIGVGRYAYAADGSNAQKFEQINVLDDLKGAALDGEEFKLEDYAFDTKKETTVFSFVEFCYSFYGELQADYGLYVYVYNPKGLHFDTSSTLNMINLRAGSDESKSFHKYHLTYLNCSTERNYEGLFYKFKVNLSSAQKQEILGAVNSGMREYRVGEIELLKEGDLNATKVTVGTSYYFSGYAGGYGPASEAESTLEMTSEQKDVLELEVFPTQYRPDGSNGKNEYTQDSLHSVYFSVPNDFIEMYGEMAAVHATWLNAVLAPALVTGNEDAYDAILPFLGKTVANDELSYHYYGAEETLLGGGMGSYLGHTYGFAYNLKMADGSNLFMHSEEKGGKVVSPLYTMYWTGGGANSADSYTVTFSMIKDKLLQGTKAYGGELVNGKYSRVLFDSVDAEFTEMNIPREQEYDLTKEVISQTWWEKLWGKSHVESSTTFNNIRAIYPVAEDDVKGTPEEVCKRLYISEMDYEKFMEEFDKSQQITEEYEKGCTLYLFRYQVTDYISQEATLYDDGGLFGIQRKIDTNAYFFQETVNLDFDIIDVTFSNGEVDTVIPVAMSPIDIIPNATPPLHTTEDPVPGREWYEYVLAALGLVLLGFLLYKIFAWIFNGSGRRHV